jgi:hypothetical protein
MIAENNKFGIKYVSNIGNRPGVASRFVSGRLRVGAKLKKFGLPLTQSSATESDTIQLTRNGRFPQ